MRYLAKFGLLLTLVVSTSSAAIGQGVNSSTNGRTYIVAAGGAGGYTTLYDNLADAFSDSGLHRRNPVICRVRWGVEDDNINDYLDVKRHRDGARKMSAEVQRIRQSCPGSPIVLMGYSAGCSVVLPAAEQLPPNCVDRIILLGPAVSARYDVRRALLACKCGIDSFNIPNDDFLEGIEDMFGAPYEAVGTKLACTSGFLIADPRNGLKDPILAKLHQHRFTTLPHGHFTTVSTGFLRQNVLPLIPPPTVR